MGKEDYVVICGDFGGVWHTDRKSAAESPEEAQALDWLENRPFTTLFIPGNHENYHIAPGKLFDEQRAEQFEGPGKLIIPAGEEIVLEK